MLRTTVCCGGLVWLASSLSGNIVAGMTTSGLHVSSITPVNQSSRTIKQPLTQAGAETLFKKSIERPMIAVDIDETLSVTDYNSLIWGIGKDDSTPLEGAVVALRRLSESYELIYVTARSRSLAGKTERWLNRFGFPKGRLVTSPTLGDFIFQSGYKRRVLSRLRSEYPNLVVGIGDKASDAKAYRACGMLPVIVNPWPRQRYRADDVVLRDWAAVSAFFETNHELLSDAEGMNRSLKQSRGPLYKLEATESDT